MIVLLRRRGRGKREMGDYLPLPHRELRMLMELLGDEL